MGNEAAARIKINKLLEEAGWRFFDVVPSLQAGGFVFSSDGFPVRQGTQYNFLSEFHL